jgi:demethylspheroidene O-methyltransferase
MTTSDTPALAPVPRRGWWDRLLWDRVRTWRDRALLDPRVHRLAFRLPFSRLIARRRARQLFDLCAGFVYTQVLLAVVRLRVLEALVDGPLTTDALAEHTRLSRDAATRLLGAAVALELLERRGPDAYGLGTLGAAMLASPGVAAMVAHHPILYDDLRDPVALLRGEIQPAMSRYWGYVTADGKTLDAHAVAEYSALMAASQPLVADEVLDAYDFGRHRHLLDVGGGEGAFISSVGARHAGLALTLFDLPAVVARADARLARNGLDARVRRVGGSFKVDPLPTQAEGAAAGPDVITLVRVIHDHDDDVVRALLAKIRATLPPDGVLVVAEPMAETGASLPVGDAYFAIYLLAMGSGRSRTTDEVEAMLREAGFAHVRRVGARRPIHVKVMVASAR